MTKIERQHLSKVAALGCIVCSKMGYRDTPAEIHHLRSGMGIGQRSSHFRTIPLCPEHHRGKTGVHGLGTKGFFRHFGYTEDDLLAEVHEKLLENQ